MVPTLTRYLSYLSVLYKGNLDDVNIEMELITGISINCLPVKRSTLKQGKLCASFGWIRTYRALIADDNVFSTTVALSVFPANSCEKWISFIFHILCLRPYHQKAKSRIPDLEFVNQSRVTADANHPESRNFF